MLCCAVLCCAVLCYVISCCAMLYNTMLTTIWSAAVDTACSSSLVTTHLAAQALMGDEIRAAASMGVNLTLVHSWTRACLRAGMLSEDGRSDILQLTITQCMLSLKERQGYYNSAPFPTLTRAKLLPYHTPCLALLFLLMFKRTHLVRVDLSLLKLIILQAFSCRTLCIITTCGQAPMYRYHRGVFGCTGARPWMLLLMAMCAPRQWAVQY